MDQNAVLIFTIVGCMWLIVSPRVHTGIVITSGLMLTVCGTLAALDESAFWGRGYELRSDGIALTLWGVIWQNIVLPQWRRHLMTWGLAYAIARHIGVERRKYPRQGVSNGHKSGNHVGT